MKAISTPLIFYSTKHSRSPCKAQAFLQSVQAVLRLACLVLESLTLSVKGSLESRPFVLLNCASLLYLFRLVARGVRLCLAVLRASVTEILYLSMGCWQWGVTMAVLTSSDRILLMSPRCCTTVLSLASLDYCSVLFLLSCLLGILSSLTASFFWR